jgi:hypothetical protein
MKTTPEQSMEHVRVGSSHRRIIVAAERAVENA